MNRTSMWASLLGILAVVAVAVTSFAVGQGPKYGLDLQGGISAIYTPVFEDGAEPDDLDGTLEQTISIIRQRVDSLGVAEPEIQRVGSDIQVQLPGVTDTRRANEIIGRTAQLAFHPVARTIAPGTPEYDETPACIMRGEAAEWIPSPDRPTFDEHGVLCSATLGPSLDEDAINEMASESPSPAPGPSDAPSGAPSPSSDETAGDATSEPTGTATPDDTSTESADTGPATVVAAQQDDVSEAPTPDPSEAVAPTPQDSAAPTDGATPDPNQTLSPEDLQDLVEGFEFNDGLPFEAPRPVKYVLDAPPAADGDELSGDDVESAVAGASVQGFGVTLDFDADGQEAFRIATADAACDRDDPANGRPGLVAIVLDDMVESAPTMAEGVQCGEGLASGATISTGDQAGAEDLAVVLNAGALPLTLEPTTFTTVSPTLGASSLRNGLIAGLVGLGLVAIYLLWFYRFLGLIALGSLLVFGSLVYGSITLMGRFGFALTLAGVAGVIVAVGITADSSIIYFERIRDEVAVGKTTRLAVARGFDSAFRTNLAGNTVTLVAAVILYAMAVGPVRGFAFTLGLATLLDLVIMWTWSRSVIGLLALRGRLTSSIRRRQAAGVPTGGSTSGGAA